MNDYKHVSTPMPFGAKFKKTLSPNTPTKQLDIQDVPYGTIVGKFMYLITTTWPDLAYVVNHCTQFMANPSPLHWVVVKRIFRKLTHSSTWGIFLLCRH
jgi:hypothetical protein